MKSEFSLRQAARSLIYALVAIATLNLVISQGLSWKVDTDVSRSRLLANANEVAQVTRFHISQIQQFFSDVGATLDPDGFTEAEKHFGEANQQLDVLASQLPLQKVVLDDARAKLGVFFEVGKKMGEAYLAKGREAGNAVMKEDGSGFDARAESLVQAFEAFSKPLAEENERVQTQVATMISLLRWSISIINVLTALGIAYILVRTGRQLESYLGGEPRELHRAAERIAGGDLDFDLPVSVNDTSSVMAQMNNMQAKLKEGRAVAIENARIRIALDNVSTNVLISDSDRRIIYANKSFFQTFSRIEDEIRVGFPSFSISRLIGSSIDQFHKNPGHQGQMLATFVNTFRTEINLGGRTFALTANPVIDSNGDRLGSVVEWLDRTAELAIEREIASVVDSAVMGDFSRQIATTGKAGFFRVLAEGMNKLLTTSETGLSEVVRVLHGLSAGNLTETIDNEYHGTFGKLKDDSNKTVANLSDLVVDIMSAADAINGAVKEIAAGNTDLSQRTEQQASSLEETASSMEQLAATVRQNAESAKQANLFAAEASSVAIKGGNVVSEVIQTMSAINHSSHKVVDIISVIDGIAFQTNILALNAAVEAARAGEQGRGFAVVAGEVRNLAQRSASAAKEIKQLISDSVSRVDDGAKLVENAGKTMDEIVASVRRVTTIMAEISAASAEQSAGIEQVNLAITHIDESTQQNAALVEEAAGAAESLAEQANNLSSAISRFRLGERYVSQGLKRPVLSGSAAPRLASRTAALAPSRKALPKAADDGDEWAEF